MNREGFVEDCNLAIRILENTKKLIPTQRDWLQSAYAANQNSQEYDKNGVRYQTNNEEVCKYCMLGALIAATRNVLVAEDESGTNYAEKQDEKILDRMTEGGGYEIAAMELADQVADSRYGHSSTAEDIMYHITEYNDDSERKFSDVRNAIDDTIQRIKRNSELAKY